MSAVTDQESGVHQHRDGRWHAEVWDGRTRKHVNCYVWDSAEQARTARDAKLAELAGLQPPASPQPVTAVPDPPPSDDIWQAFEHLQSAYRSGDIEVYEATVKLPAEPVLVVFSSDWHVGNRWCDMARLRADLETVQRAKGAIRLIVGGDLFSMGLPSAPGGQFEEICPPSMQRRLVDQAVGWIADYTLALLLGNHDARSVQVADFDPVAALAVRLRDGGRAVPYFGSFGLLQIRLGAQTWRVLSAHKFRMRSSLNKTHQAKRLMDLTEDADVVFCGHTHDWAAEVTEIRRRIRVFGQAGSYQVGGAYGKAAGFNPATPRMPGVILFPEDREPVATWDAFGQGVHLLASYRRDITCQCQWCRTRV